MIEYARLIAAGFGEDEIAGFFAVAWDEEGGYRVGFRLGEKGVVSRTILPSWIGDIIRREMIEKGFWSGDIG